MDHGKPLPRLSRKRSPWPDPRLSVSQHIRRIGNNEFWHAIGPAKSAYDRVSPDIKSFLERHAEELSSKVTWSIYMVGETPDAATPVIIFCSEDEKGRKGIKKIIDKSGILGNYPGIKTAHLPWAPELRGKPTHFSDIQPEEIPLPFPIPKPEPLMERCEIVGKDPEGEYEMNTEALSSETVCDEAMDFWDEDTLRPDGSSIDPSEVYGTMMGEQLFVQVNGRKRLATVGGMLQSGNVLFYFTSAHPFDGSDTEMDAAATVESDYDIEDVIEFENLLESDVESEEFQETGCQKTSTSLGSLTPEEIKFDDEIDDEMDLSDRLSSGSPGHQQGLDNSLLESTGPEMAKTQPGTLYLDITIPNAEISVSRKIFCSSRDEPPSPLDYVLIAADKEEIPTPIQLQAGSLSAQSRAGSIIMVDHILPVPTHEVPILTATSTNGSR